MRNNRMNNFYNNGNSNGSNNGYDNGSVSPFDACNGNRVNPYYSVYDYLFPGHTFQVCRSNGNSGCCCTHNNDY